MICGLNNIIHFDCFVRNSYSIGFKNISSLFFCKSATLNMVRVVSHIYLYTMIDATLYPSFFLFS